MATRHHNNSRTIQEVKDLRKQGQELQDERSGRKSCAAIHERRRTGGYNFGGCSWKDAQLIFVGLSTLFGTAHRVYAELVLAILATLVRKGKGTDM